MATIKKLVLDNFAGVSKVDVNYSDKINYLVGVNGSGKSTVGITGLHFIMQGIANRKTEDVNYPVKGDRFRFIGDKGKSATGILVVDDKKHGEVTIIRKITKSGQELQIIPTDENVHLDQKWLTDLFNYFMIAPKQFAELSPKEQALSLGIDTADFDSEIAEKKKIVSNKNAIHKESKGKFEKMKEVITEDFLISHSKEQSLTELSEKVTFARDFQAAYQQNLNSLKAKSDRSEELQGDIDSIKLQILELGKKLEEKEKARETVINEIGEVNNEIAMADEEKENNPELYDLEALNLKIAQIEEFNKNVQKVEEFRKILQQEMTDSEQVEKAKAEQKASEEKKKTYLLQQKLPFKNMSINDKGELEVDGKYLKPPYFSTGELIKLIPILLSKQKAELKYVFVQDFDLLDKEKGQQLIDYLLKQGFQLVIEHVGKEALSKENTIIMKDCQVVEDYNEAVDEGDSLE